ncbi:MAG: glycine betaine ABC transporter substrate-binding protein [Dysgonomonas sp.]
MIKRAIFIILILSVAIFSSCERRHKQDVLILYPNWADGIAITHLGKIILEEKGYSVTIKRLEPGPIFAALSRGDADLYMDAWLPYTHKDYWDRYSNKLDTLGSVFKGGTTGLVVPTYVDINSIEELNANKDKFGSKIYGIGVGAGIYFNTEKAIKEYNLQLSQQPSSETSMVTALKKAIANKEWIVITGWKPHFMWSNFNLKTLDDPKNTYPTDAIKIITRKGFSSDKPEITSILQKYTLSEDMLNELMVDVDKSSDPEIGAKIFYDKYKDILIQ